MKILHINSYFSTSRLFSNLYERQIQKGHELTVYVPIAYEYPKDKIAASGDYTDIVTTHHQWDRLLFHYKHRKILKDILQRYPIGRFDLIHAHSLFSNGWVARQLFLSHQIPYIVAVRNADVRTFFQKAPWLRSVGLNIMRDAQAIVFISENSYKEVFDHYVPAKDQEALKAKTKVIANGIDDYWHLNAYDHKTSDLHQPLRIISTGKLLPGKRFIQLAEMVQNLSSQIGPIEFHVVGPDWEPKIAQELREMDFVTYHGPLAPSELAQLYRQMDIFALLSYPETFGLVYPEAMSQGLPVIYTRNEGFDSFFDNYQVGVSVDRFSQEEFNEAVTYICSHYAALVKAAVKGIHPFKWDRIIEDYERIYHKVLMTASRK
ncbi:glycosyltransferase family 4 protein [Facklamia languida]